MNDKHVIINTLTEFDVMSVIGNETFTDSQIDSIIVYLATLAYSGEPGSNEKCVNMLASLPGNVHSRVKNRILEESANIEQKRRNLPKTDKLKIPRFWDSPAIFILTHCA